MRQTLELWGQRGWHSQEVAGESNYTDALQKILGAVGESGTEIVTIAELVPEPKNKYDRNAIQVLIQGMLVGYLPREDAARYEPVLAKLIEQGWQPQVGARIWGGITTDVDHDHRGRLVENRRFYGSVRLDLTDPHLLVPANLPPDGPHVVLPLGHAIQVTDEDKHLANLMPLLSPHGECWVHATLHEIVESTARTTKSLVEVRVDGAVGGKLTPKMSSELLPVVKHLQSQGISAACRAILKGNHLKADITLYVVRSGELSAGWLADPPISTAARRTADADLVEPMGTGVASLSQQWRFNPPPGWPPAPTGWAPPQGWSPPAHLPPAPADWHWWLPA